MTNRKAIEILREKISLCVTGEWKESVDAAISALQAQDLQPTCNNLATDTISRTAAIDTLLKEVRLVDGYYVENDEVIDKDDAIEAIQLLPSAQPENIRCYECKHGTHSGCGNVYICNVSPELVMEHTGDFYCGYAKRKTDGEVD